MKQAEGIGPELALGMIPPLPYREGLLGHGSPSSTSSLGDVWQKRGRYPGDERSRGDWPRVGSWNDPPSTLSRGALGPWLALSTSSLGDDGQKGGRYPGDETSRGDWPRVGSWNAAPSRPDRKGSWAMAPLQAPPTQAMIGKKGGGIPGMKQAEGIGPELALGMIPRPPYGVGGLLGHGSPSSTSSLGDDRQKGEGTRGCNKPRKSAPCGSWNASPSRPERKGSLALAPSSTSSFGDDRQKGGRYPGDETSRGDLPRSGSWNAPPSRPDRKGSRAMAPLQAPPPLAMIGKRGGGIPGMKQAMAPFKHLLPWR